MPFDPSAARSRVEKLWSLGARFGLERNGYAVYLEEIVSDRYQLVNGLQLLRDELQLAGAKRPGTDVGECAADPTLPSVVTTLAHTNCGDRVHQGEPEDEYHRVVASRFATLSEIGELKIEAFSPTGGGTDDGATLAHVTVGHQLDEPLREWIYGGNAQSFVLACFDLKTHVGRLDGKDGTVVLGRTQESPWREPRAACGAIIGTLAHHNLENPVHRRIRSDLGEDSFAYLSDNKVLGPDGTDFTGAVAAAIVAVRGLWNTLRALAKEFDQRGVGHATASVVVNRVSRSDTLIYLARGTVFGGEIRVQGLGLDARRYSGSLVEHGGDRRVRLLYDGQDPAKLPVQVEKYDVPRKKGATYTPLLEDL